MKKIIVCLLLVISLVCFVSCDAADEIHPNNGGTDLNENNNNGNPNNNENSNNQEQEEIIKHKITFILDDYTHLEASEIEYVEGEGLDSLPVPMVDAEFENDDYNLRFIYWYMDNGEEKEVVTSISKDETRDFVLKPMLQYNNVYNQTFEKYRFDIEDNKIYPFVNKSCLDDYPRFDTYALIKLVDKDEITEVNVDNKIYYKVNCVVEDIYDIRKLEIDCKQSSYYGNCHEDGSLSDDYFVYISKNMYSLYEKCDKFIVPANIKYSYGYDKESDYSSMPYLMVVFPTKNEPISIFDYVTVDNEAILNFYPVVEENVLLSNQSEFVGNDLIIKTYIEITYKKYLCDSLSLNPTFEEFSEWLIKSIYRLEQRVKYCTRGSGF